MRNSEGGIDQSLSTTPAYDYPWPQRDPNAYVAEELYQHHGLTSVKMIEAAQALME